MEKLLNKKWWQKLIIALFIIILFSSIVVKPVQAMSADILLKPITGLFVGLADALEGVMQKIILGVEESLIEVKDEKASFWANFFVIGAFIVATAIAIVAAIPSGGSSVIAWVGFVVIGLATVAISCGSYAMFGSKLTTLIEKMIGDQFYFPQFALSPYEIFDNKITVLDVNFFNPKETERVEYTKATWIDAPIPKSVVLASAYVDDNFCWLVRADAFDDEFNFEKDGNNQESGIPEDVLGIEATAADALAGVFGASTSYSWYNGDQKYFGNISSAYTDHDFAPGVPIRRVYTLKKFEKNYPRGGFEWIESDENIPNDIVVNTIDINKLITNTQYVEECVIVDQEKFDQRYAFTGNESQKSVGDGTLLGTGVSQKTTIPEGMHYYVWKYPSGEGIMDSDVVNNYEGQEGDIRYHGLISDIINIDGHSSPIRIVYQLKKSVYSLTDEGYKLLKSPANELRTYIAGWYKTFRNLALVALLSILVYIGIRILLSTVASDKAKYKQMLLDWAVALCMLFVMHYIMSFSVYLVDRFRDMIDSIQIDTETKKSVIQQIQSNSGSGEDDMKLGQAVEIFILDGTQGEENEKMKKMVKNAYNTMGKVSDSKTEYSKYFFTNSLLETNATSEDNACVLVWPAQNFMEQARINYQIKRNDGSDNISMYGYGLIYVILVIYTIIFLFTYMKRIVYMAFLTVIAPLVAVTYPIDKLNDGKAQAFDMWFKEYIFNLLIQPLHLVLYSVLIGSAMNFAADNLVYVVMALGFFVPAEKLLRRFFGFEKAQTPGMFGGPAGSALMFSGLQRLMHPKPPRGLGGGNGDRDNSKDEESKAPRTQKIDETEGFLGSGNDEQESGVNWGIGNEGLNQFRLAQAGNRNQSEQENNDENTNNNSNLWGTSNDTYTLTPNVGNRDQLNNNGTTTFSLASPTPTRGRINTGNQTRNQGRNQTLPRRKRVLKGIRRTLGGYGQGVRKRYVARKAQKGGLLRRGIRLAGGVTAATTFTAAAGVLGITSGDINKAGQYMATGAIGGYKVGSSLGDKASNFTKDQKDIMKDALKEGKKGYQGSNYGQKQQEKYLKEFKKNEENLNALQDKLNIDRKKAQEIMESHAQDYIDNDITNMDEFAAVYKLEHEDGMGRQKAIATRHYAMDRLDGQKIKNIDPEKRAKYDDMFSQEFIRAGRSETQANRDVNELYNAINKFHKYKK